MILTDTEIAAITRRKRHAAQAGMLRALGIEYRARPDGSLVVLRSHVEHLLGGEQTVRFKTAPEPDWSSLRP